MRQLRVDLDAAVATRRHRTLPVQRVRTLRKDERRDATTAQTTATPGECWAKLKVSRSVVKRHKVSYGTLMA